MSWKLTGDLEADRRLLGNRLVHFHDWWSDGIKQLMIHNHGYKL